MKICELLLDRIIADDYFYNERLKYLNNHCKNKKIYLNFLQNLEKQDMDLLFKILNKQSKKWWD
jgi:poly-D-alanine transfer protein DltD